MKTVTIVLGVLILGMLALLWGRRSTQPVIDIQVDTITTVRIDTVHVTRPLYVRSKIIDTLKVVDTLISRDTLYIPITQRVYQDSNYTAYVSGYMPSLDSISLYNRTVYRDITHVITPRPKRFGLGVQVGYGGGKNGFSPYVGVGVSYNVFVF